MPEEHESRVEGNRLVVGGNLSRQAGGIQQMLKDMLRGGSEDVEIDLSSLSSIRSSDLAVIASAAANAQKHNRKVRITAAPDVARILRFGGVDRIAEIDEPTA